MKKIQLNLYQKAGWFDPEVFRTIPAQQFFVTGGRGIGKSFSTIEDLIRNRIGFLFLRRIDLDAYLSRDPDMSDIGKVLRYLNIDFYVEKVPKTSFGYFRRSEDDSIICFVAANKTFRKCRGMSFDWCDVIVYDEFIPGPEEARFKGEGFGVYQALETVGRNRELEGREAVKLICLSNALNMQNDVFLEFDLLEVADDLLRDTDHEIALDGGRCVIICKRSPISEAKLRTETYMNASDDFVNMAIRNQFIYDDFTYVEKKNLKEYRAVCAIGPLYIYRHKSKSEWYVSFSKSNVKEVYSTQESGIEQFTRKHWRMTPRFLDGKVKFQNYKAQTLFERFIGRI